MKGLYPTVMTQPSPRNDRFYPVPVLDKHRLYIITTWHS
jgi:hypothetical protein